MDNLIREIWSTARDVIARLSALMPDTSSVTLQWAGTGVLGLAAILYAYYQLRTAPPNSPASSHGHQAPEDLKNDNRRSSTPQTASMSPVEARVHTRLQGMRCITISCPHILLKEAKASELEDGAQLRDGVVTLVQEMARHAEVFLLAHVEGDIGEATVRGALEGLVGPKVGQIPPHRLLFCSTLVGKVSIVRQLEPDLHLDSSDSTVGDLKRFIPRLVQISEPGSQAITAPNVASSSSMCNYFRLTDDLLPMED